jgi:hypothetical protein
VDDAAKELRFALLHDPRPTSSIFKPSNYETISQHFGCAGHVLTSFIFLLTVERLRGHIYVNLLLLMSKRARHARVSTHTSVKYMEK